MALSDAAGKFGLSYLGEQYYSAISNNIMPYFLAQEGLSQNFSAVSVRVHLKAKEFGLGSYLLLIWDLTIFAFGGRSLFCREASKVC